MQRLLVIGKPGAGKSTLAVKLARIFDLPLIHLDKEFWQPGWVETPRDLWRDKVSLLAAGDRWIIDGNYDGSLDLRLPRAQLILYLDFPTRVCLWRIVKRIIGSYGQVRSDMAGGCPEQIDWVFIKYVINFNRDTRPGVERLLRSFEGRSELVRLQSQREVDRLVAKLRTRN